MNCSRSAFLTSSLAAISATVLPAARVGAAAAPVRIGALGLDLSMQAYYAERLGMFRRFGIDVEISNFQSGGSAAAALVGGSLDVGFSDVMTMVSAHSRDVPMSFIAPAGVHSNAGSTDAVLVASGSPIRAAKDFNGKIVATNGIKNTLQIPFEAWIDNSGGDSRSVQFVEMSFAAMLPALQNRQIDAAIVVEPFITIGKNAGRVRELVQSANTIAPVYALDGWAVRNDWAAANPQLVKRLVEVMAQAAAWGNANRTQSAQMLATVSRMPPALAAKVERCTYSARLQSPLFQPVIDAAARYDMIERPFAARDIFNPAARL